MEVTVHERDLPQIISGRIRQNLLGAEGTVRNGD